MSFICKRNITTPLPLFQSIVDTLKKRETIQSADAYTASLNKAEENLADCLCQTGDFARARVIYDARLKAGSQSAAKKLFYYTEIAGTYFREDNYKEAEHFLTMASATVPEARLDDAAKINETTKIAIYLGESLYRQDRYADAIKVFQQALGRCAKNLPKTNAVFL